MWTALLDVMLKHFFRHGTLHVTMPDGTSHRYGSGSPETHVRVRDKGIIKDLVLNPELAIGEGYMDGRIEIDDLRGFFAVAIPAIYKAERPWFQKPLDVTKQMFRKLAQSNSLLKSRSNVSHHYDLSGELYDLFLDADRQYSCAYFARPDMTLDEAQEAKKHHIAHKLRIEPGMKVLDIGCGDGVSEGAVEFACGPHRLLRACRIVRVQCTVQLLFDPERDQSCRSGEEGLSILAC